MPRVDHLRVDSMRRRGTKGACEWTRLKGGVGTWWWNSKPWYRWLNRGISNPCVQEEQKLNRRAKVTQSKTIQMLFLSFALEHFGNLLHFTGECFAVRGVDKSEVEGENGERVWEKREG